MAKPLISPLPEKIKMDMAKDPVCGMTVDEEKAEWTSDYKGKTYYFCNERCKNAFEKAPQRYVK